MIRIDIQQLLTEDKFKSRSDILEIFGEEEDIILNIPSLSDESIQCKPLLLNTLARSAREYSIAESKEVEVVYGIYIETTNVDTGLSGIRYITPTDVVTVLEEVYTTVSIFGCKVFVGENEETGAIKQVLDNIYEYLDFSDYEVFEVLLMERFRFLAITRGDVSKSEFLLVEIYSEDSEEEEVVDSFVLRDRHEVDDFFFELFENSLSDITDKEILDAVSENHKSLRALLSE